MKIVIDIDEEVYGYAKRYNSSSMLALRKMSMCMNAVANGTPLPKRHGDLIDRNDLLEYTDINRCAYTPTINRYGIITTPTIIEGSDSE